jgi:hypothetical protein
MKEHAIQREIIRIARILSIDRAIPGGWKLAYLCHFPNGLYLTTPERRKYAVGLGVLPGMPDLLLPCPSGRFSALWLEVKAPKGKVTPTQLSIHADLIAMGNLVRVVRSASESEPILRAYLCDPKSLEEWVPGAKKSSRA